jgi:hypothetical protein
MQHGGADERVAAVLYTGVMTLMGVSFGALWTYATRHRDLLGETLSDEEIRVRTRRFTMARRSTASRCSSRSSARPPASPSTRSSPSTTPCLPAERCHTGASRWSLGRIDQTTIFHT